MQQNNYLKLLFTINPQNMGVLMKLSCELDLDPRPVV